MLGEQSFQPYAINTFSHRGKNFEEITPIHYVRPHEVRSYTRRDVYNALAAKVAEEKKITGDKKYTKGISDRNNSYEK